MTVAPLSMCCLTDVQTVNFPPPPTLNPPPKNSRVPKNPNSEILPYTLRSQTSSPQPPKSSCQASLL